MCLKGVNLLFYSISSTNQSIESQPKHLILIRNSLCQRINEHPKKQFLFCLSSEFGDAYLMQAQNECDLIEWIQMIHQSNVAAMSQLNGSKQCQFMIQMKINEFNDLLSQQTNDLLNDKVKIEIFKYKNYYNSIDSSNVDNYNLENEKLKLLTSISQQTKHQLNRLAIFNVSSIHSLIYAKFNHKFTNQINDRINDDIVNSTSTMFSIDVYDDHMTFIQTIKMSENDECEKVFLKCKQFAPQYHWFKWNDVILQPNQPIKREMNKIQILNKQILCIRLARSSPNQIFGFSIESRLNCLNELQISVSKLEVDSLSWQSGLLIGDEIIELNNQVLNDFDVLFIENQLINSLELQLTIGRVINDIIMSAEQIESMVCPPPPTITSSINSQTDLKSMIFPSIYNEFNENNEKLTKIINELIDTETVYCNVSSILMR